MEIKIINNIKPLKEFKLDVYDTEELKDDISIQFALWENAYKFEATFLVNYNNYIKVKIEGCCMTGEPISTNIDDWFFKITYIIDNPPLYPRSTYIFRLSGLDIINKGYAIFLNFWNTFVHSEYFYKKSY